MGISEDGCFALALQIILLFSFPVLVTATPSKEIAPAIALRQKLYHLEEGQDLVDITDRILSIEALSPRESQGDNQAFTIPAKAKQRFLQQGRRFYLFTHLTQKHKNCLTYLGLQR